MLFLSLCGDNICNTTATPTNHRPIEMTHAPNIYKSTVSWSNLSDTKSTWSMNYSQHRMTFCHRPLRISMPPPVSSAIDSSGHDLIIEYRSPPHPKRIMFLFTTHHFKKIWLSPPRPPHAKISAGVPPPSHTGNKQQRAVLNATGKVSVFHPVTAYHDCPNVTRHELHTNSSLHMEGKNEQLVSYQWSGWKCLTSLNTENDDREQSERAQVWKPLLCPQQLPFNDLG